MQRARSRPLPRRTAITGGLINLADKGAIKVIGGAR